MLRPGALENVEYPFEPILQGPHRPGVLVLVKARFMCQIDLPNNLQDLIECHLMIDVKLVLHNSSRNDLIMCKQKNNVK